MNIFDQLIAWFANPDNWQGANGIPTRFGEQLAYSGLALLIAAAIALPIGAVLGHLNKGEVIVISLANTVRALPTFGLLTLLVIAMGIGLLPPLIALVVLAVPPLLVNTFEGMRSVNPAVVSAAKGIGLRSVEVMLRVRVPSALPLIMLGIRLAAIQVISTATIAAYVGLGGFGRYIFDGLSRRQLEVVIAGSVLVAALAVATELLLILCTSLVTSRGVTQRKRRSARVAARKPQSAAPVPLSKGN